jgi:serine/threonine-protein kinase ATR
MVPDDVLPKLDALNTHTYSLAYDAAGVRRGVHPEAPDSSFNAVNNLIRWRDANAPGTPVWVTEWGWDAARPTETCGTSTECVSQQAQAAYAIRGLSLLARKGVAATHWFFYGEFGLKGETEKPSLCRTSALTHA